jgi:hypothetical protein
MTSKPVSKDLRAAINLAAGKGSSPHVRFETGSVLEVQESLYDHQHCPSVNIVSQSWESDGVFQTVETKDTHEPRGYFAGGSASKRVLSGATFALRYVSGRHLNGCEYRKLAGVVLFPGWDEIEVIDAILDRQFDVPDGYRFLVALHCKAAAKDWLLENFDFHRKRIWKDLCYQRKDYKHKGSPWGQSPKPLEIYAKSYGWAFMIQKAWGELWNEIPESEIILES